MRTSKKAEFSFIKLFEEATSQKCQKDFYKPCGNQAQTGLLTPNGYLPICFECLGKGNE
jgi:hypothetical protein